MTQISTRMVCKQTSRELNESYLQPESDEAVNSNFQTQPQSSSSNTGSSELIITMLNKLRVQSSPYATYRGIRTETVN